MKFSFFIEKETKGSAICRGIQISEKIDNASWYNHKEFNIEEFKNDVCIWVKCFPNGKFPKRSFIDIIDKREALEFVKNNKNIGVIGSSITSVKYIEEYINRDVILIPHHHCNFDNEIIPFRSVSSVGFVGDKNHYMQIKDCIENELPEIGLEFKKLINPKDRLSVVEFLKSIDIQISFRDKKEWQELRNPLKLSNGGSFKIPTIAYPEPSYLKEYKDLFLIAETGMEIISWCDKLKNNRELYNKYAEGSFNKSKNYHIDKIIKIYHNLSK